MNDLADRLFKFATDTLKYLNDIKYSDETRVIKYQLSKSATSAGANYEESQGSSSKQDFRNKVFISLKEMRESNYWLRICREMNYGDAKKNTILLKESKELMNILGSIVAKINKA
jgi:four helix bundle protein